MLSEAEPLEQEEAFFWENPSVRAALIAKADIVNATESDADSESEQTRVTVKRI